MNALALLRAGWAIAGKYLMTAMAFAGAIFALVFSHRQAVKREGRKATNQEADRITRETERTVTERKEEAREIDQAAADLPDDDLRKRMRAQARNRDR